ncbi:MAG: hypothetical protein K1X67_15420 [Fimbriimonadaceae bacterium]|nr:hypothetical protein [Fimbriimonadaceae bacterium]
MLIPFGLALAATVGLNSGVGLNYREGAFIMNDGNGERRVIISPPVPPAQTVFAQKLKNTWMVWDERGLTVRTGAKVSSTRFPYIPTSPKVMSREQIGAVVKLVEKGERQKDASGLAGHLVVGDTLFLLVRWADANNKPWLEVLMKVDTTAAEPKPEFVAKMPGTSLAKGEVDDQLFKLGTKLATLSEMNGDWGISAFALEDNATTYTKFGHGLVNAAVQRETSTAYFTDRTAYGTQLAGEVDLVNMVRTNAAEARGTITYVSTKPPILRIADDRGVALRFLDTGADVRVPDGTEARMTGIGVLTWAPKDRPSRAALYEPTRWIMLSTWVAPPGGVAEPPKVTEKPIAKAPTAPVAVTKVKGAAASMALAAATGTKEPVKAEPKKPEPKKPEPKKPEAKKPEVKKLEPAAKKAEPVKIKKKPKKPVIEVTVKKKGG